MVVALFRCPPKSALHRHNGDMWEGGSTLSTPHYMAVTPVAFLLNQAQVCSHMQYPGINSMVYLDAYWTCQLPTCTQLRDAPLHASDMGNPTYVVAGLANEVPQDFAISRNGRPAYSMRRNTGTDPSLSLVSTDPHSTARGPMQWGTRVLPYTPGPLLRTMN